MRVLLLVALAAMGCKGKSKDKKAGNGADGLAARDTKALGLRGITLTPDLNAVAMPEGSAPLALRFDWKAPCTVPAKATLAHKDGFDEASFEITLSPGKDVFEAAIQGLEVIGRERTSVITNVGRRAVGRNFVLPSSTIGSDGKYIAPRELEEFSKEYLVSKFSLNLTLIEDQGHLPNKAKLVQNGARKQWDAWVGSWLDHSWVPGQVQESEEDVLSAMGVLPSKVKRSHLGHVKGRPDLYVLEMSSVSRGLVVETQIMSETKELLDARGQVYDALPEDFLEGYKSERTTKIAVDANLRPYRVRQEEAITTKSERVVKVLDTMFEWDKAKGCGK